MKLINLNRDRIDVMYGMYREIAVNCKYEKTRNRALEVKILNGMKQNCTIKYFFLQLCAKK